MNKLLVFAAAGAACLAFSTARAAVVANPGASTLSIHEVEARTLQPYEFSRKAYQEFRGEYLLENGARLRLSQFGRRFFAEVTGQPRIEVRASTSDTFVALEGGTELVFEQHANGLVSRVLLKQSARS